MAMDAGLKENDARTYGHNEGTKTIRKIALEANRLGVKAMTVYAFLQKIFLVLKKKYNLYLNYPKNFLNFI